MRSKFQFSSLLSVFRSFFLSFVRDLEVRKICVKRQTSRARQRGVISNNLTWAKTKKAVSYVLILAQIKLTFILHNFWKLNFECQCDQMAKLLLKSIQILVKFKKWANSGLFFFIFVFSNFNTVNIQYNFLPMTGFGPRTSGVGSNRSTNWATTTDQIYQFLTCQR